jgi:hypothetical protein
LFSLVYNYAGNENKLLRITRWYALPYADRCSALKQNNKLTTYHKLVSYATATRHSDGDFVRVVRFRGVLLQRNYYLLLATSDEWQSFLAKSWRLSKNECIIDDGDQRTSGELLAIETSELIKTSDWVSEWDWNLKPWTWGETVLFCSCKVQPYL